MQGFERAAILLLGMGENEASEVLRHLNHKQVQRLGETMAKMSNVSREEIQQVLIDFVESADKQTSLGVGSEEYIKKILISALGDDIAGGLIGRIFTEGGDINGLDALKWMDARTIADVIRYEHPQVIAIVLTYLDSDQAAQVLGFLPREICVNLMMRMASLENIQPVALEELNNIIQKQFAGNRRNTRSMGGTKTVADIMNSLDKSLEVQIMEGIKGIDTELSDQIRDLMFVFDNLMDVDDKGIQAILKEVPSEILILGLKGADDALKEKLFSNMSKRAAELLRDDLESKGPVKLSDVEKAQKEILAVARRLEEEGAISLGRGADQMV